MYSLKLARISYSRTFTASQCSKTKNSPSTSRVLDRVLARVVARDLGRVLAQIRALYVRL